VRSRGRAPVHLALIFVQVTFGAFHVVGKSVLGHLSPLQMAGLRVAFAAPFLLALAWKVERVIPARRHLPILALLGLLGVFANQVLYMLGLNTTTASNAGILMLSIPVFTAGVAAVVGVERPSWRSAVGVGVAVVGAFVFLHPDQLALGRGAALGNALILGNCLAYALYLVLQRPILAELPPLTVVAWAFLFGGLGVLLVSLRQLHSLALAQIPAATWLGVAYIVLIPTAVNYAINTWALRTSSPRLVATYTTLQPVAAAALAALFLGERIGAREVVGFLLIVGGLAVVSGKEAS
jgi:drug/metabolite transporter (DMT)-like permease